MKLAKRTWRWLDDRTGLGAVADKALFHPVPKGTNWLQVLGSAVLVAFIVQIVTGIALLTVYVPTPDGSYQSLQYITEEATLGRWLRGTHYFGASAMLVLVTLHTARVYLTGSYKYPREFNWLTGAMLIILTFMMAFTGQLLRWDTHSIWSTMVAIRHVGQTPIIGEWLGRFILAGQSIGGPTLTRAFAFHVLLLPLTILGLIGVHLFLLIRNGISEPPEPGKPVDPDTYRREYEELLERDGEPFWPFSVWRDAVFGTLLIAGILTLGYVFGPKELGMPPDPTVVELEPRPDWYFLWYYALYAVMPQWFERWAIWLIPMITTAILFTLPFLFPKGERSPLRRPWAVALVLAGFAIFLGLWEAGTRAPWAPELIPEPLTTEQVGVESGPIAVGAVVYQQRGCLSCHMIDGAGGRYGPDLSRIGAELAVGDIAEVILNGAPNMPAYESILSDDELDALLLFLESRPVED